MNFKAVYWLCVALLVAIPSPYALAQEDAGAVIDTVQDSIAQRDTISTFILTLDDSTTITGRIIEETPETVIVVTAADTVRLSTSSVIRRRRLLVQSEPAEAVPGGRPMIATVMLRGGSSIKGEVVSMNPLAIRIADSTVVPIAREDVELIRFDEETPAVQPSRQARELPVYAGDTPRSGRKVQANAARFTLFGGAALPAGAFGSDSWSDDEPGFAKLGFAAGFEWNSAGEIIQAGISGIIAVNACDIGSAFSGSSYGISAEATPWVTGWLMGGVRLGGAPTPNLRIFGEPQIGIMFGASPAVTMTSRNYYGNSFTSKSDAAIGYGIAYGIGWGITVSKFSAGMKYLASKPKYTRDEGSSDSTFRQSTSLIFFYVGVTF